MSLKKYYFEDNCLILEENNEGMSLTNSIEDVVESIREKESFPTNTKIIYEDTEGNWDGVIVKNKSATFVHLNAKSKNEAINKYKELLK